MINEGRCFHTHPPSLTSRLEPGTALLVTVVCVHVFGLGVYAASAHAFGHIDAPFMGLSGGPHDVDDYPQVGSFLDAVVLGYSGTGQLRLQAA